MTRRAAFWPLVIATLIATLLAVSAAFAQTVGFAPWQGGMGDLRVTCSREVRQFCAGVPRGEGRIVQCLTSYRSQLSQACSSSLNGPGPARGSYGAYAYAPSHNPNAHGPDGLVPNASDYAPSDYGPGPNSDDPDAYVQSPGPDGNPGAELRDDGPASMPLLRQAGRYATAASAGAGDPVGSIRTKDGRTRTYVIHYPAGYDGGKTYPLVLLFHGGGGAGAHILSQTRFAAKADQKGFIVVAPDGVDSHWNDGRGTTNTGIDDVGFVRQLIADLRAHLPIDPKRIYATGLSNGAVFTERLGCELSDTLAAIGTTAGPLPANLLSSCKPGPISMVGIQGDADPGIPLAGGEMGGGREQAVGGMAASAAQTMRVWANANGCHLTPAVANIPPSVNDGTRVIKYSFTGCTAGTGVVYYVVQGMGHGWPPAQGAMAMRINGPTSQNISATDVMWAFFSAHPR